MSKAVVPAEHLPEWMGAPIDGVSAATGLPSDQLRMLACLLAAVPLGWLHRVLPTPTVKHLFSTIVGAFFAWFVVGNSFYCVPVSAILVYIIVQVVPRSIAPTLVFVASLAWLSGWHIYRLYVDYMGWSLDATLVLMVWTVKACTFAYNVADGQALNAGEKLSERESTHQMRAERALTKIPSLLEYFSFVFFFGGVLVGPCFEAKEYFDFTDGKLLKRYKLTSLPSTVLPALRCVATGLLMYAGLFVSGYYPILGFVHTDAFASLPWLQRYAYFWLAITSSRFKYYFAWCLGEAGCVATGLGLNGVTRDRDDKVTGFKWDRVSNCNMLAVETAPHMSDVTNNWNMGVNNWLKNYVYFRVSVPGWLRRAGIPQKSFANLVTKMASAFWHGFYVSYYIFFFGAFLAGEMDDALRKAFGRELSAEEKKARATGWWKGPRNLFELCCFLLNNAVLNFWGVTFVLLDGGYTWSWMKNMGFLGIWLPIVVTVLCRTVFRKKRAPRAAPAKGLAVGVPSSSASFAFPSPSHSPSPEAKVVTAAVVSAASPNPPPPEPDMLTPEGADGPTLRKRAAVDNGQDEQEDAEQTPAQAVKSRPRRSRSNKAD